MAARQVRESSSWCVMAGIYSADMKSYASRILDVEKSRFYFDLAKCEREEMSKITR